MTNVPLSHSIFLEGLEGGSGVTQELLDFNEAQIRKNSVFNLIDVLGLFPAPPLSGISGLPGSTWDDVVAVKRHLVNLLSPSDAGKSRCGFKETLAVASNPAGRGPSSYLRQV